MRITTLAFNTDQEPDEVTLTMTASEAAWITKLIRHMRPIDADPAAAWPAVYELGDCLQQKVFLPYFDDGVDDYLHEH